MELYKYPLQLPWEEKPQVAYEIMKNYVASLYERHERALNQVSHGKSLSLHQVEVFFADMEMLYTNLSDENQYQGPFSIQGAYPIESFSLAGLLEIVINFCLFQKAGIGLQIRREYAASRVSGNVVLLSFAIFTLLYSVHSASSATRSITVHYFEYAYATEICVKCDNSSFQIFDSSYLKATYRGSHGIAFNGTKLTLLFIDEILNYCSGKLIISGDDKGYTKYSIVLPKPTIPNRIYGGS